MLRLLVPQWRWRQQEPERRLVLVRQERRLQLGQGLLVRRLQQGQRLRRLRLPAALSSGQRFV
jgi:hypothetical protein